MIKWSDQCHLCSSAKWNKAAQIHSGTSKFKSYVWNYFGISKKDDKKSVCKSCLAEVTYTRRYNKLCHSRVFLFLFTYTVWVMPWKKAVPINKLNMFLFSNKIKVIFDYLRYLHFSFQKQTLKVLYIRTVRWSVVQFVNCPIWIVVWIGIAT